MPSSPVRLRLLSAGLALAAIVQVVEVVLAEGFDAAISTGDPDLTTFSLLGDLVLSVGMALVVVAFGRHREPDVLTSGQRVATVASLVVLALLLVGWLFSADLYRGLGGEDGPFEWIQAAIFVAVAVLFQRSANRHRSGGRTGQRWIAQAIAVGAVVFAGDEISWGQRIFDFESTGAFLTANDQAETSLHNFFTVPLETAYFTLSIVFLVALPLAWHLGGLRELARDRWSALADFVPAPWIALVAASSAAVNRPFWNILPVQATFALSIVAVVWFWRATSTVDWALVTGLVIVMVITHLVVLVTDPPTTGVSEIDEYREMIVAFGVLAWAVDHWRRTTAITRTPAPTG